MPTRDDPWPDGMPCWVDCQVDDTAKATKYYSTLFGWEIQEGSANEMGYLMALKDGHPAAGIGPKPPGVDMPSVWSTYIASSDVDATVAAAKEAGGQFMMDPFDVGEFGRMAFGTDPTGAAYGIWQAKSHFGAAVFYEDGSLGWNELHTKDVDGAKAFYSTVFGWEYDDISTDEMTYLIAKRSGDDQGMAGIFHDAQMPPEIPANWLVWFAVADCDQSTATAADLDSATFMAPTDSPFGRMAVMQAPQGEMFGLIDPSTTVGEPPTPSS